MKLPTLFNPSNDMALAANVRQYFPPKRIQQMEEDLAALSEYWEEGPWGWSRATKLRYEKMGIPEAELPSDEWLNNVRQLSSREFAVNYIQEMLTTLDSPILVGRDMAFRTQRDAQKNRPSVRIFKSPWSSSGRGVFTSVGLTEEQIEKRLEGFVSSQGGYLVDTFYEKEMDFAMEFYVHGNGDVEFLGYSVFEASENGTYGYNYVESQEELRRRIGIDEELLIQLIEYHEKHLPRSYCGPVGIDMLKCRDGRVHPCIEINLRMNMGILAIKLFDRFGGQANVQLTPQREHGFEGKIEDGKLMLTYKR